MHSSLSIKRKIIEVEKFEIRQSLERSITSKYLRNFREVQRDSFNKLCSLKK